MTLPPGKAQKSPEAQIGPTASSLSLLLEQGSGEQSDREVGEAVAGGGDCLAGSGGGMRSMAKL
jgi:hypothetical protein